jgi:hypothetical protein
MFLISFINRLEKLTSAINSSMFSIFENLEFDFSNLINLFELHVAGFVFMVKNVTRIVVKI